MCLNFHCPLTAITLQAIKTVRVNPAPVDYWGDNEELTQLFAGEKNISTDPRTGQAAKMTFTCHAHAVVAEDPEAFASAVDPDGVTGVHACALNGYVDTLKLLVEEGGADPFVQTRSGIDALMMARRRGHREVGECRPAGRPACQERYVKVLWILWILVGHIPCTSYLACLLACAPGSLVCHHNLDRGLVRF